MSQIINEDILWDAAEKLRDKCDPADYKNVVLGLVFLKYVSDKYTAKYNELKKYNKSIANYKKAMSGLNTNFKFLDAQNVMTIQEKMAIEEELDEFQNKFKEITKYVNL